MGSMSAIMELTWLIDSGESSSATKFDGKMPTLKNDALVNCGS